CLGSCGVVFVLSPAYTVFPYTTLFRSPESMGAITLAAREDLDNLIFVINCNLQRLDGPVRGNGSIIQELEAAFRGAGWIVIKVIDRKSTRLNSSHVKISYAVFCLKKKN